MKDNTKSGCASCGETDEKCEKSKRDCGHHCNCSWEFDECCWCGKRWDDDEAAVDAPKVKP